MWTLNAIVWVNAGGLEPFGDGYGHAGVFLFAWKGFWIGGISIYAHCIYQRQS
jgi:hypothetical protein